MARTDSGPTMLEAGAAESARHPLAEAAVDRQRIDVGIDRHLDVADLVAVADAEEPLARVDLVLALELEVERAEAVSAGQRGAVLLVVDAAEAGPHAELLHVAEQRAVDEAGPAGHAVVGLQVEHRVEPDGAGVVPEDVARAGRHLVAVVGVEPAADRGACHLDGDARDEEERARDELQLLAGRARFAVGHTARLIGKRGAGHRGAGARRRLTLLVVALRVNLRNGVGRQLGRADRSVGLDRPDHACGGGWIAVFP